MFTSFTLIALFTLISLSDQARAETIKARDLKFRRGFHYIM